MLAKLEAHSNYDNLEDLPCSSRHMCVYRFYFRSLSTAPRELPSWPQLRLAWAPGERHSQGLLSRAVPSRQPGLSGHVLLQDESTAEITFYMKGADVAMASIVQYNDWLEEEVCARCVCRLLTQRRPRAVGTHWGRRTNRGSGFYRTPASL